MPSKALIKAAALLLLLSFIAGCGGPSELESQPTETLTEQTQSTQPSFEEMTSQQIVAAFAQQQGIPVESYPTRMIEMIDKNPEMLQYVLDYPFEYGKIHEIDLSEYVGSEKVPLFLQWDKRWGYLRYGANLVGLTGCGPVCLSMVAFHLTQDETMSPDRIVRFAVENKYCLTGGGSSWQLVSDGAVKLGLHVKELSLSEAQLREALEQGHPVICNVGPGVFTATGHYIVFVGYEDGKFQVNDPNSRERSARLWSFDEIKDQVRNWWAISLQ